MYIGYFTTMSAVGWPNRACMGDKFTKANGFIVRNGIIDSTKFIYCVSVYKELFKSLGATLKF